MTITRNKEKVALLGASGTMGYEAFKELWKKREKYDIILLLLPQKKEKKLFKRYEKQCGIKSIKGRGIVEGEGLKIIWGDVTEYSDVEKTCRGVKWVLDAMAFISPMADYYPEIAQAVNTEGIKNIIRAIESQPGGAENINLVYTGTVAETGDRLPDIHYGRVGDPLKPSVFDYYAVTKIAGERAVLESKIKHWVSLRMTFILPGNYKKFFDLQDPIMFHQPLNTCMENITARDAGFGMVNCLDISRNSDFWRKVYNMGGGPGMRCTAYEFMNMSFQLNGLSGIKACSERKWFALRNFHMQYYDDSFILNRYLHYWRDSLDSWSKMLKKDLPAGLKIIAYLSVNFKTFRRIVEKISYNRLKKMAYNHKNGTGYWYKNKNDKRITAFYKSYEDYEKIPDWDDFVPDSFEKTISDRIDHGYDESKGNIDLPDLIDAAEFRGGKCLSKEWNGSLYEDLEWECAEGHKFRANPYTVLKAGHWCSECMPPPWNFDIEAQKNPFFAQVWYPNHDKDENNIYPVDCLQDIYGADNSILNT